MIDLIPDNLAHDLVINRDFFFSGRCSRYGFVSKGVEDSLYYVELTICGYSIIAQGFRAHNRILITAPDRPKNMQSLFEIFNSDRACESRR